MNKNVNESDFDWTNDIPDNPIRWVEPEVTYDNVERDEDGYPLETGDGSSEIWVDFERYSNDERIDIIRGIEEYLGSKLRILEDGGNIYACTSNQKKGLIIHCGHEDNYFFAQKNHVCCMSETYDEFMEMERNENPSTSFVVRPRVDGGIFLEKENLTEGFYYKGVNPTVDLIVIRGDEVLLIQRDDDAEAEPGKWALPGGFHDTNAKEGEEWKEDKESSLEAAKREVKEETGLDVDSIKGLIFQMVGVFEGGGRDPRDKEDAWTRSTVYMVHIPENEGEDVKGMDDAQRAEWVSIDKVLQHKLAFDHHKIIEKALSMNMNEAKEILKTLLTESDEFQWVKDTPELNPLNQDDWVILFDNGREYQEAQRWLFNNGLCWDGHYIDNPEAKDCGKPWPSDEPTGFLFKYGENEHSGGIDAYSYKVTEKNGREKRIWDDFPNHTQYNWSDIGDQLMGDMIKEDLDWVKDVPEIPFPQVGDKFMWNRGRTLIVITNVEHDDGDYMSTLIEFTSSSDNFRDAYTYKNWVEDYEDGFIKPILKEDFDWAKDVQFQISDDYIKGLMSNCKDIQITNYNLNNKSPYLRRGKMNIMYYSMCPYWWDLLKDEPVDENGRGEGEWFEDGDNGKSKVAVIMPNRNGVTDIRGMVVGDYSAITYDLKGISNHFNGKHGELWILLDDNGDIRYDLIPEHLVDEVRQGFEGVDRMTTLEESFGWTEDIPEEIDEDLYTSVAYVIDNEVSQGPGYDRYTQSDAFRRLSNILIKHNIDIDDMGNFFNFGEPKDMNGNHITNYQLIKLKQDLIDGGFMMTDEETLEMNESTDFDWMEKVKPTWLRIGQKFTSIHHLKFSKMYEPKDKVQVGSTTFEIYDINNKQGQPHLRFTHNDVMDGRNWERKKEDEIGQNYGGTKFTQAKHNIDTGFWIPLTDCEFIASTHPNLVGETKPDGSPYGHIYCLPDTSFGNIKESTDFDWTNDAMDYEGYRFFDVHVCYENFYDEETGEDECDDGGSYFIKIPKDETEKIWKLDVWDNGGPGDEGLGVIEWAEKNGVMVEGDYQDVDYVVEVPRVEFCRAVGHSNQDACPESQLKESEFDWAEETPESEKFEHGDKYVINFKKDGDEIKKEVMESLKSIEYRVGTITRIIDEVCYIYLEDYRVDVRGSELWDVSYDTCPSDGEEYQEIQDIITGEGYKEITSTELLKLVDNLRGDIKI